MTMIRKGLPAILGTAVLSIPGLLAAGDRSGYSLTVLVDGTPVVEYAARDRVYVEALKGREFSLRLTNPTSERIAVALSVDGRNVIDAKRTGAREAAKWILGPGQTLDVPGWQVSGKAARKFVFTETSSSYAKWLGDTANVGTIEAVFYREKRRPPVGRDYADQFAGQKDEAESRSSAPGSEAPQAPTALGNSAPKLRESDSYAATGIGDKTDFAVEWVSFEEEKTPSARIALRYEFRTELVRLGVLPRADELFARDRAHGFTHDYAPDPYRR
jgi:hypothetical protein